MIVIYDSLTGQTKRFAERLGLEAINISDFDFDRKEEVLLCTRSHGFGKIPDTTLNFLKAWKHKVVAVAVSGNRNWGANYGAAGDKIEKQFKIPLIRKFEGPGFPEDREYVIDWIKKYNEGDNKWTQQYQSG